jgi:hypothetical protein
MWLPAGISMWMCISQFFFGGGVLGFELRDLIFLGKPPALFALVIFQIGSHVYTQAVLDCSPPLYASCGAGITGSFLYTQLLFEMGLQNFSAWSGLEPQLS